jgi:quercetin dioxygenase-like cupin family protein
MEIKNINSQIINWDLVDPGEVKGETGFTATKEFRTGDTRIRVAEYSANYKSAEWCPKGHIIYCIEGELKLVFKSGIELNLSPGNSIIIEEGDEHIGITGDSPVRIFIVD